MHINIALVSTFFLIGVGAARLDAQIAPNLPEREAMGVMGNAASVYDVNRSWSQITGRYEPLAVTNLRTFTKNGRLKKEGTYTSHVLTEDRFYYYDKDADSVRPIYEVSQSGSDTSLRMVSEGIYVLRQKDEARVGRVLRSLADNGTVILETFAYNENGKIKSITSVDSTSGLVRKYEQFFYFPDGKPSGSSIWELDAKKTPIKQLTDTASLRQGDFSRTYTSYTYGDTLSPIIF